MPCAGKAIKACIGSEMRCDMAKGLVYIYTGDGKGKSSAALGRALQAAIERGDYSVPERERFQGGRFSAQDGAGDKAVLF